MKFFISFILLILTMNAMNLELYQKRVEQLSDEEKKECLFIKVLSGHLVAKYTNEKSNGIYTCKICDTPLYKSNDKFDSNCIGLVLMMQLRAQ